MGATRTLFSNDGDPGYNVDVTEHVYLSTSRIDDTIVGFKVSLVVCEKEPDGPSDPSSTI